MEGWSQIPATKTNRIKLKSAERKVSDTHDREHWNIRMQAVISMLLWCTFHEKWTWFLGRDIALCGTDLVYLYPPVLL